MRFQDLAQVAVEVLDANMDKLRVEDYVKMYGLSDEEATALYRLLDDLEPEDFHAALTSRNARKWVEKQDLL